MTIYFMPLEKYIERYTYQLQEWTERRFQTYGLDYVVVEGKNLRKDERIKTGVALDAHGRSYYALTQTAEMVRLLQEGDIAQEDILYNQDMFQPGWEAIPYILDQMPPEKRPRTYTHCLAQSIDVNDFTFPMRRWMRHYELLVDSTISGILVASDCMVDLLRMAMFTAPIHLVGLMFDKYEVRERAGKLKPLYERKNRVVFASRWDEEKQPWFYMDMIEKIKRAVGISYDLQDCEFAICTGAEHLRSNKPEYVRRAKEMEKDGKLVICENLTKNQYYKILGDSRAHFNCALQDFVSNTLNEASALGTPSLLPAYLSFPEAVNNNRDHLYVPWSIDDAIGQLNHMIQFPPYNSIKYPADTHTETLEKVIDVLNGLEDWLQ